MPKTMVLQSMSSTFIFQMKNSITWTIIRELWNRWERPDLSALLVPERCIRIIGLQPGSYVTIQASSTGAIVETGLCTADSYISHAPVSEHGPWLYDIAIIKQGFQSLRYTGTSAHHIVVKQIRDYWT